MDVKHQSLCEFQIQFMDSIHAFAFIERDQILSKEVLGKLQISCVVCFIYGSRIWLIKDSVL